MNVPTSPLRNILSAIPPRSKEEYVDVLAEGRHVRVERIVSRGHKSPRGFWYDQEQGELVVLLKGRARLRFEGKSRLVDLQPGDCVNIPPHMRHRVEWTAKGRITLWLCIFYD